jgi:hypothetical protein
MRTGLTTERLNHAQIGVEVAARMLREGLGAQARKRARDYSVRAMADATLAAYRRVCERKADKAVAEVGTYA